MQPDIKVIRTENQVSVEILEDNRWTAITKKLQGRSIIIDQQTEAGIQTISLFEEDLQDILDLLLLEENKVLSKSKEK